MTAIGLMSGTSRDGIDAALLRTDGETHVEPLDFRSIPYDEDFREQLRLACEQAMEMDRPAADPLIDPVAAELTRRHASLIEGWSADIIGFHGHTVAHRPDRRWTWQIGDGHMLAKLTDIDVVADLRSADVAAGGQGAPLLPVYHRALAAAVEKPLVILNLGGVANITFIGDDGTLIAFDTGMASGLIDNWMQSRAGVDRDTNGETAASGRVDEAILASMMANPWFDQPAPKSIDREEFTIAPVSSLSVADGAATLTAFTAISVERGLRQLPNRPHRILVAGGGRHNATMMHMLADACHLPVEPVDGQGWNGDAVEAQGFAYMAVRSLSGLPISFPGTTGAPKPMTGGTLFGASV